MTRVVISQPMYFPWAGFLAQMALADVYIWLDDTQFSKGSFTNRVQVKTSSGIKWMSIPLEGKGSFRLIRELAAGRPDWHRGHRALLEQAFRGRPHAAEALELFDRVDFAAPLSDCLIASAEVQAEALAILPATRMTSTALGVGGRSWERVLNMVKAVGGSEYVSGMGGLAYLDHEAFEAEGVAVSYMDYAPVPWPQEPAPFTPYVTGLDLVASVSTAEAARHLNPATLGWRDMKALKENRS
jgi:hypothetical protein